ncbi:cAMP-independent regulatory protein pac2 [Cucumispora dikerogammari]|nr:cAMP-independent regulatory protein pac2 [Cucumispora dikerogammari]
MSSFFIPFSHSNQELKKLGMQTNGYIHKIEDAELVVHAIRFGLMESMQNRLSKENKGMIQSGQIYCFRYETEGMKRWTDGRIWSPSRVSGKFLIYKEVPRHLSKSQIKKIKGEGRNVKQEVDSSLDFFKKTAAIKIGNVNYHVIAYFNPIFDKRPLSELPFYRRIAETIKNDPKLLDDDYLNEKMRNYEKFKKAYNLLELNKETTSPDLDRKKLEEIALSVLCYDLKNL